MRCLTALLLTSLLAAPAAGQVSAERLTPLKPGARLRIVTSGEMVQGRFAAVSASGLTITTDGDPRVIPLENISTVWERKRHGGRGALIGGVIGAAAFTGFLHVIISALCDSVDGCPRDHNRAWGYGIVLGGAGGGLIGAGVGSLFTRWEQRAP